MPILNPNFAIAGERLGEAAYWAFESRTAKEAIAGFGSDPELAQEDFEHWSDFSSDFGNVTQARAFFANATVGYESFAAGWPDNTSFISEFSEAALETASFGVSRADAFDWYANTLLYDWDGVAAETAAFSGDAAEDFRKQWSGNDAYAWDWTSVASAQGGFDGGTTTFESFDNAWQAARIG